jgi:hypothetical protein
LMVAMVRSTIAAEMPRGRARVRGRRTDGPCAAG